MEKLVEIFNPFILWCRWHWHNGPTSFPDDHPVNRHELKKLATRRLGFAVRNVQIKKTACSNIKNHLHICQENSENDHYKHRTKRLNRLIAKEQREYTRALRYYFHLWDLYKDVGMLEESLGTRRQFLRDYNPLLHLHKSTLKKAS